MTRATSLPADRAANDAQAQLQQIVDHTSAAMFVKDLDGRFLFVNREFERMKGMPVAAIVGRLDGEVFPSAAAELRRNDRQVVDERRAIDFEESVETAQGTRTYLAHKFPLLDASGRAYAVCGVATDITERKRSEEALRAAALAVTSAEGEGVFHELVRYLSAILEVDVAMIAVHVDGDRTRMRTLAVRLDGKPLANFEYALDGSPCRHVVGREFRFVGAGVQPEFPPGTLFAAKGMDSYAALPLNDSSGAAARTDRHDGPAPDARRGDGRGDAQDLRDARGGRDRAHACRGRAARVRGKLPGDLRSERGRDLRARLGHGRDSSTPIRRRAAPTAIRSRNFAG